MKFIQVTARFDADDIPLAEELICDIFFFHHLKGVVCQVPIEEPDEGFGTSTLPLPDFYAIIGFFPCIDASDTIVKTIKEKTGQLSKIGISVTIETSIVDEDDWADAWKDFFEVTPITDRIIVKPEWKDYLPQKGEIIIHLDPGMAFGTGTHPTTAMCTQLIEKYLHPGHTFLDVGTGSGILMIAAAKLGADLVYGIDIDETAIQVARENLFKNQIPSNQYDLEVTTLDQTPDRKFNIIAANIIAQVIVDITPDLAHRMDDDSIAVLSGIILERLPEVLEALEKHSLEVSEQVSTDEWVALAVKKRG